MTLRSYFFPQTIFQTSSSFNHDIRVIERNGRNELVVNDIQQTGPYVRRVFLDGLTTFNVSSLPNVKNILLLGVGGGFMISQLHSMFPDAHIDALDIDPTIIDIAQRFFSLPSTQKVEYIVADAQQFVQQKDRSYDFIFIDLYIGDDLPAFLDDAAFYRSILHLLTAEGRVLINYQGTSRYEENRKKLLSLLPTIFSKERHVQILQNCLIYLQK